MEKFKLQNGLEVYVPDGNMANLLLALCDNKPTDVNSHWRVQKDWRLEDLGTVIMLDCLVDEKIIEYVFYIPDHKLASIKSLPPTSIFDIK